MITVNVHLHALAKMYIHVVRNYKVDFKVAVRNMQMGQGIGNEQYYRKGHEINTHCN